jgi:hypothetical protein
MQARGSFNFDQPFTREHLRLSGHSDELLRLVDYRPVFRGVWIRTGSVDRDTPIRAALTIHPETAIASHFSAARLHGLPLPEHRFEHVMVFDRADRRYRPEIKSHLATRPRPTVVVRGIETSDLVSTFVDLARYLSLVDLVIVGDWIVRHRPVTPAGLVAGAGRAGSTMREQRCLLPGSSAPGSTLRWKPGCGC